MSSGITRRSLLVAGLGAGVTASTGLKVHAESKLKPTGTPLCISSGNGMRATAKAMEMIKSGADTLDAVIEGVQIVELDPNDMSVGYGGLPNEEGVVELDASVMHGPTYRAGAVGALQNIKTPAAVARVVMKRTNHVMLVGAGALKFAKAHGFKEENILTEAARESWLRWKENLSDKDDWLSDKDVAEDFKRPTGTITCLAINERGDISGTTTTSGLAFKVPGRVGDSPIIGAGLYVDNEVGACGSTGRGESNILVGGSRVVVENMKRGMTPEEAILDVLRRVCAQTLSPRLLNAPGKPNFQLSYYALNKKGEHAGLSIYKGGGYAVHDGTKNAMTTMGWLHESMPKKG